MTIKSFERPIIELSHSLVHQKARFIDNEYKLSINDLSDSEKMNFIYSFIHTSADIEKYIQEYLNCACIDRMYAESQERGGFDE